ncbi:histidinol dehydrogenase [Blattabacterium sp. (Periplaneta americana) str. BPLAN]|uniref:histidinol dehydrogenase n=1 Tax=Blattabacterium sp. (Periplaneta americana) TaxID=367488 RepID=UPI0001BA0BC1|nr:histidinol dehydrogenase [Blattabacterium sp. (Periplaneta americana)]ACX83835.1 histidinol dehydrogenase [Blattabacterium sp. (Periplaneta americana) str. BPLAN]
MDIQVYIYPPFKTWKSIIKRSVQDVSRLSGFVLPIINNVKLYGDIALKSYTKKYDHVNLKHIQISEEEINESSKNISDCLKKSIEVAHKNIQSFHKPQIQKESKIEVSPGVICWRKSVPIEKVGLYIPGGSAPLLSTVLMLGVPSNLAGCEDIILCSPPNKNGKIHPSILYTATKYIGIKRIYKIGGAQAIAAMAYGTESVSSVYKIFGPGNSYVTLAKQIVAQKGIVSIDMPAGPSEVVILADETANPEYVASDLISQSEHDPESYILLITISISWMEKIKKELKKQLTSFSTRQNIMKKSLERSKMIVLSSLEESIHLINQVAPEHLIINCHNASYWGDKIKNAGSVFLGNYSPVSVGDYASGTNHVLPTYGYAKSYSGVSVDSFLKKITFQKITKKGLRGLSKCVGGLSLTEGLIAHKKSIDIRLKNE